MRACRPLAVLLLVVSGGFTTTPAAGAEMAPHTHFAPRSPAAAPKHYTATNALLIDESRGTVVRSSPGGPIAGHLSGETPLGTPRWLWAVATTANGRWARVVLPWRPNGRAGWVTLSGRRVVHSHTWVQVDLSRRRVKLMRWARVVDSFAAAVGAPDSRTPIGRFSVTDPISTGHPSGPFGWYAFGLSGHQPHLPPGWSGGDQLALHGTNDPASIGTAASAGCLRVSAFALGVLRYALRPGTPVVIHP